MDGNIKYTEDKDEDKEKTYNYGKCLVIVEYFPTILPFKPGWWLSPTPLKNDGVSSSVGKFTSQLKVIQNSMVPVTVPVTTNQLWKRFSIVMN